MKRRCPSDKTAIIRLESIHQHSGPEIRERINVLFLTKYARAGASSRYRTLQYIEYFCDAGLEPTVSPLFSDAYLRRKYSGRRIKVLPLLASAFKRLRIVICSGSYDLVVVEKELFPYCPVALERILLKACRRYSIDMDDALFHIYDRHKNRLVRWLLAKKFEALLQNARLITCGSPYLLNYSRRFNNSCTLVPTVVDVHKYQVRRRKRSDYITVGWIGTPNTQKYLYLIQQALHSFFSVHKGTFLIIGASPDFTLEGVPTTRLAWSEEMETSRLADLDVGVMPLPNEPLEQGKSGLKLIQYMAAGVPVVASPVGVNSSIVSPEVGMLARTGKEWLQCLNQLGKNPDRRKAMGERAQHLASEKYSLEVWGGKYAKFIQEAALD